VDDSLEARSKGLDPIYALATLAQTCTLATARVLAVLADMYTLANARGLAALADRYTASPLLARASLLQFNDAGTPHRPREVWAGFPVGVPGAVVEGEQLTGPFALSRLIAEVVRDLYTLGSSSRIFSAFLRSASRQTGTTAPGTSTGQLGLHFAVADSVSQHR
jgi:hypothetical protein